jgi:DNA repair photolyase
MSDRGQVLQRGLVALQEERIDPLRNAGLMGIKTWVSFKPVITEEHKSSSELRREGNILQK